MKIHLLLGICLFLACGRASAQESGAVVASRPPDPNCVRKKWSDKTFEFYFEKCDFGFRRTEYIQKGTSFYEVLHDTEGARPDTLNEVLTVYSKSADETAEAAIKRLFFPALSAYQKAHCKVTPQKHDFLLPGKKAFDITPDPVYERKIKKDTPEGDMPEPPCGEFGFAPDSITYFEYHPDEDKRRILYVRFGQEEHPDFDEKSLKFLP